MVACDIKGTHLKMRVQIISMWKMFYRGNKNVFFLPGFIKDLSKHKGVPLFYAKRDTTYGSRLNPLSIMAGCNSKGKRQRMSKASSRRVSVCFDDEDPLLGARVEDNLMTVQEIIGSTYNNFTPVQPNTALEVMMLCCQLQEEEGCDQGSSDA